MTQIIFTSRVAPYDHNVNRRNMIAALLIGVLVLVWGGHDLLGFEHQHSIGDATCVVKDCSQSQTPILGPPSATILVECHPTFSGIVQWLGFKETAPLNSGELALVQFPRPPNRIV
jgi:hypothetical protein